MDLHTPETRAALDTLTRVYRDEIRGWVSDFEDRAKRKEFADADEMREAIEQDLDGSECVVYTYKARLVAMLSDSFEAARGEAEDMGLEHPTPEQIAFLCMKIDVMDWLDFDALFPEEETETDDA